MDTHRAKINQASQIIHNSLHVVQTPLIPLTRQVLSSLIDNNGSDETEPVLPHIFLKCENLQNSGCFKIRGVVNQFHHKLESTPKGDTKFITMSAGNYGKTFAMMCQAQEGVSGMVCMPDTAPIDRIDLIQSYGSQVLTTPSSKLQELVQSYADERIFLHPFDDMDLIYGYASIANEIMTQRTTTTNSRSKVIVFCPCGGGGLLAGVALGLRSTALGKDLRIVGVEPAAAPGQYQSRVKGEALDHVTLAPTIASGLAPPMAGALCYSIIQDHVDDLVLVTEGELKAAMSVLFRQRLVVEPSGGAAFAAAVAHAQSMTSEDRQNTELIVVISGGNISIDDYSRHVTAGQGDV